MFQQQCYLASICKSASVNYPEIAGISLTAEHNSDIELHMKEISGISDIEAYTEPGALYFESRFRPSELYAYILKIETLLKNNIYHSNPSVTAYCEFTLFNLQKALKNEKK